MLRQKSRFSVGESNGRQVYFLDGNSFSGTKKYQGSNSSDGGNTKDGVKTVCGVIGAGGEIGTDISKIIKIKQSRTRESEE
ncbi:hypothetical protein Tco_1037455 [Tanacetum coccineum]